MLPSRKRLGIFFLVIAFLLILHNLDLLSGSAFLLILGFCFIAIYLLLGGKKRYGNIGFLIPGTILIGIWLSSILPQIMNLGAFEGPHFFFLIGLAFFFIFLFHTFSFSQHTSSERYWPLYPTGGLFLFSFIIYLLSTGDRGPVLNKIFNYLWVLVFLGIGLKLIFFSKKDTKKDT